MDLLQTEDQRSCYGFGNLVVIEAPQTASPETKTLLIEGITKFLRLVYRPFAGNKLFFYDQRMRLLQDELSWYEAEHIIASNIEREPGVPFEGYELFNEELDIHGFPSSAHPTLRLENEDSTMHYTFTDQYTMHFFQKSSFLLAKAYVY